MSSSLQVLALRPLPLSVIDVGPGNPRKTFHSDDLQDLAASVKEHGVFQPIIVTPSVEPERYRLIAGERRFRASRLAGREEIPALIVIGEEDTLRILQLNENLQRVQLSPMEEAFAFQELLREQECPPATLARRIQRRPEYVKARLALLNLTPEVQAFVSSGALALGTAAELVKISSAPMQIRLARHIAEEHLTVAQASAFIREQQLEERRRARRAAQLAAREAVVSRLREQGKTVLVWETFQRDQHKRSSFLVFPECATCTKKGVFVEKDGQTEDVCVDALCYERLNTRDWDAFEQKRQRRQRERTSAFLACLQTDEIQGFHLRYLLWTLLYRCGPTIEAWRLSHDLPPPRYYSSPMSVEWEFIQGYADEDLLAVCMEVCMLSLASLLPGLLPDGLKASLISDAGVPGRLVAVSGEIVEQIAPSGEKV